MDLEFAKGDTGADKKYRANELYVKSYPNNKKVKKTQKNVVHHTTGIAPPAYEIVSVHTGPVEPVDIEPAVKKPYKERRNIKKKGKKRTFDICGCNQEGDKIYNEKYLPKNWDSIEKFYGDTETTEVLNSKNQIISVYEGKYKNEQLKNDFISVDDDDFYYNKKVRNKYKTKNESKKDNFISEIPDKEPNDISVISLFRNNNKNGNMADLQNNHDELSTVTAKEKTCQEGPCVEATKNNNKSFLCKCVKRKDVFDIEDCTDSTCKSNNILNSKSIVKLKDKILYLCRKYSQKIVNMKAHTNTCKEGVCHEAKIRHKHDFKCKCKNLVDECSDKTCEMIALEHQSEQTGEPFFEVRVSPRDMCVLNPLEIRENVLKYGKLGWHSLKCTCPSRGRLKPGEVCPSGICKKAYKKSQADFKCWCDKRITECGDTTCGVHDKINMELIRRRRKRNYNKHIIRPRVNKPLLEVKLDKDKMCVVNPKEIEEKMVKSLTVNDVCYSGVCRHNEDDGAPHYCRCISRKMMSQIKECSGDTCKGAVQKKKWYKSDSWSLLNRDRNKRRRRRSFYEIGSQKSPNSGNVKQNNATHLQNCNCGDCKLDKNKKTSSKNKEQKEPHRKNGTQLKKDSNGKKFQRKSNKTEEVEAHTHKCKCKKKEDKLDYDQIKRNSKKKLAEKLRNKKISRRQFNKEMKRRAKADRKAEFIAAKQRLKEIRAMQKKMQEQPLDTNFCTAFLLGVLKMFVKGTIFIIYLIIKVLKRPKESYWYIRDRITDPQGTYNKLRKWFRDAWLIKKLQISETIRGSDTLTILADHFLDTPFYQTFASKGHTRGEQMAFERKSKERKRRIRRREQQAIYSCRHNLLTTLRKTPCLWVYHICPNFYPQCLGLLGFMRNFSNILLFLVAFACWTPCILSFEMCRALMCCVMCTR